MNGHYTTVGYSDAHRTGGRRGQEVPGRGEGVAESAGLRVAVLPGGCSGFRYSLNIEEQPAADDVVIESAGVRLFVDEFSSQYLNGTVIDYKSNFQESGFAFENPNASGGCGCGSSFTV